MAKAAAKKSAGSEKNRAKDLLELKDLLLEEKARVKELLHDLENRSDLSPDALLGDDADRASIELSQNDLAKQGARYKSLLKKVDHALAKFDNDTYGICELTGEEIPVARLRARPFTQYTVEAKEQLEREEKKYVKSLNKDSSDSEFEEDVELE